MAIEVRFGKERHRLTANEEGVKNGCARCSLFSACRHIGQVSGSMFCDTLAWAAYESPKECFPNGCHFEMKEES